MILFCLTTYFILIVQRFWTHAFLMSIFHQVTTSTEQCFSIIDDAWWLCLTQCLIMGIGSETKTLKPKIKLTICPNLAASPTPSRYLPSKIAFSSGTYPGNLFESLKFHLSSSDGGLGSGNIKLKQTSTQVMTDF